MAIKKSESLGAALAAAVGSADIVIGAGSAVTTFSELATLLELAHPPIASASAIAATTPSFLMPEV